MKTNKLITMVLAIILSTGFYGCGKSSDCGDLSNQQVNTTSNFNGYGNFTNGQSTAECSTQITSFDQLRALVTTGNFPIEPYEFSYFLVPTLCVAYMDVGEGRELGAVSLGIHTRQEQDNEFILTL